MFIGPSERAVCVEIEKYNIYDFYKKDIWTWLHKKTWEAFRGVGASFAGPYETGLSSVDVVKSEVFDNLELPI